MPVIIEFSRCIGTYSSAKFEFIIYSYQGSNESSASIHICIFPSRYSFAYSRGSSIASAFTAHSDPGVVLNPFSAFPQSILKAALYKHYASKQDIFDKILERMNMDYAERVKKYEIPVDDMDHVAKYYGKISIEMIQKISEEQFLFWTQDTYGKCFRRMLSIEKYKNTKMAELYQYYFGESVIAYMTELFQKMIDRGMFCNCDGRVLALDFYGPIYLLMSLEDRKAVDERFEEESKDEKNTQRTGNQTLGDMTEQLRMHVKGFAEKWNMRSNR